MSKITNDGMA